MAALRPRTIPTLPKALHARDAIWKGHDDYFGGPVPPVDHMKALRVTGQISNDQRRMYNKSAFQMNVEDVIRVLNRAGVKFVLMGAHAANGWTRVNRATEDVDVLVQKSHHGKATRAIAAAYPELRCEEHPVVTRFRDHEGVVRIDVMKPAAEVHKAALKATVAVQRSHMVPNLEMMLVCKFAAMASPNRPRPKKIQDAADFALLVEHNKKEINRQRLAQLGETVYQGGGNGVLTLLDDLLAGRPMVI